MRSRLTLPLLFNLLCLALAPASAHAVKWLPFGPDGGDARSFGVDPSNRRHLYLGTANGWVYQSEDGGQKWQRLAQVGKRDDLVIDHILVDRANPKHILVGAWVLGQPDGGLYVSNDGGASWASRSDLAGQSIRALASAPSDPKIFVAGTLEGVYRSTDAGEHWTLISPRGSSELHEVESAAIDPVDPSIIYAGTWHLPWKTTDAGEHWSNIKEGVIDDSDVFSIIVNPKQPNVVYASACSGIYKSDNGGEKFEKVQGIPSTARRTRVLTQDPREVDTVFAGTTEGLFRTEDAGKSWSRTTGPELIVNDVYVDSEDSQHILVATDRGGILASHDGGTTFDSANSGFSARQIMAYTADAEKPGTVYVGVVNDKEWGGVFVSDNGGLTWTQQSSGLHGLDVFSLGQAPDGAILAGTSHGIYRQQDAMWSRVDEVPLTTIDAAGKATPHPPAHRKGAPVARHGAPASKPHAAANHKAAHPAKPAVLAVKAPARKQAPRREPAPPVRNFDGSVYSILRVGDAMFAATSNGLLTSSTGGKSWEAVEGIPPQEWRFFAASNSYIVAATLREALLSRDAGKTWSPVKLPSGMTQIGGLSVDGTGSVWLGGRDGLFVSSNAGEIWEPIRTVYVRDVNSIFFDEPHQRILVTANISSKTAFAIHLPDRAPQVWDSGWDLRFFRPVGDHFIAATLFDGTVVQPQMVESPIASVR